MANQHEVHKYIAVAHKLMAQIAIAEGDPAGGESELKAALEELHKYPPPVVTWKTYADLGRAAGTRDAFGRRLKSSTPSQRIRKIRVCAKSS